MTDHAESGTVIARTRLAEFIERLAPGADPTALATDPPIRTRQGHPVSLLTRCHDVSQARLRHVIRRGLPVIMLAEDTAELDPPLRDASGWLGSGALAAPTVLVLLTDSDTGLQGLLPDDGPDLTARLSHDAQSVPAGPAELTAASPAELADVIDDALTALAGGVKAEPAAAEHKLADLVPVTPGAPYAIEPVLRRLLDQGTFIPAAGRPVAELATGFGSYAGVPIAVLASRPDHDHGRLTMAGIRQISRFLALVDRLGIPLLSVVDSAGIVWEARPDTLEGLRDGLLAMQNLRVPKYVLLAGDAFGTVGPLMGVGMRADLVSAWPRGRIAADPDVDAAGSSVLTAARAGLALDVIHPDETHTWLRDLVALTTEALG